MGWRATARRPRTTRDEMVKAVRISMPSVYARTARALATVWPPAIMRKRPNGTGRDAHAGDGDGKAPCPLRADEQAGRGNQVGDGKGDDEREDGDNVVEGREVAWMDRHAPSSRRARTTASAAMPTMKPAAASPRPATARAGWMVMTVLDSFDGSDAPSVFHGDDAICGLAGLTRQGREERCSPERDDPASLHVHPATRQAPARIVFMVTIRSVRNWFGWNIAPDSFLPVSRGWEPDGGGLPQRWSGIGNGRRAAGWTDVQIVVVVWLMRGGRSTEVNGRRRHVLVRTVQPGRTSIRDSALQSEAKRLQVDGRRRARWGATIDSNRRYRRGRPSATCSAASWPCHRAPQWIDLEVDSLLVPASQTETRAGARTVTIPSRTVERPATVCECRAVSRRATALRRAVGLR